VSTVLRWVAGDRITGACPNHLMERTSERVVLFEPAGTRWRSARSIRGGPRGRNLLPEQAIDGYDEVEWTGDSVARAHVFGQPWSTWRWYSTEDGWSDYLYVNLEDPWRVSPYGFDTGDWVLDVIIGADGSASYKDEDELEWIASLGGNDAWVAETRAAGERAIAAASSDSWPFTADWDAWIPAGHELPTLPNNWADAVTRGNGR
jgi:hypothetical protein